jgi:hypothetical protein
MADSSLSLLLSIINQLKGIATVRNDSIWRTALRRDQAAMGHGYFLMKGSNEDAQAGSREELRIKRQRLTVSNLLWIFDGASLYLLGANIGYSQDGHRALEFVGERNGLGEGIVIVKVKITMAKPRCLQAFLVMRYGRVEPSFAGTS